MSKTVKCADCGYLSVVKLATRELVSAEDEYRLNGGIPSHGNFGQYQSRPICFMRACDLRAESGDDPDAALRRRVVHDPRTCTEFVKWQQGFSPKEHLEMSILEKQMKLLEKQREWQRQREEDDRAERAAQSQREREWNQHDREASRAEALANHRWRIAEMVVTIIGVVLVSVAAQIAAAFIERGSWFPDRPNAGQASSIARPAAD